MLDQIGTIVLVAAVIVNIGALAAAICGGWPQRFLLLATGGLWSGLAVMLAGSGALLSAALGPVPPVGVLVIDPDGAGALLSHPARHNFRAAAPQTRHRLRPARRRDAENGVDRVSARDCSV